jgi:hypothetical protein
MRIRSDAALYIFRMSAIESAFVNTVVSRESENHPDSRASTGGTNTPTACAQQDTMVKKISGLRMWTSRSVAQDRSGYVTFLSFMPVCRVVKANNI